VHVAATSVESAERVELLQERDELARELAEVKHRERRRVHGSKGEKQKTTSISPTSVLGDTGPSSNQRKASDESSNGDLNGPSASTYSAQQQFSAQSNQPLVIIDKDGNQIDLKVTVVTNERSTGGNISAKNDESSWICNVCTFENAPTAKECEIFVELNAPLTRRMIRHLLSSQRS
jgi:hypothetical protein